MYWHTYTAGSVEGLLDRHETTLETLMAIDNIIPQVRNGDSKLMA